jgi:serine/threonine protein kinase
LKDYKNIVEIGKGGFGAVYMAYDRNLKKNVAIK